MDEQQPRSDEQQARTFLETITHEAREGLYFYTWTLPRRQSLWWPVEQAASAASWAITNVEAGDPPIDCYVGVALTEEDRGSNRRVTASDASALYGLWCDIDWNDPVHSKPNLPPDMDAARTLLAEALPTPTLVVSSGHGLQAWWMFTSPWEFADEEQRALGASLAKQWNLHLLAAAQQRGWTVDSVYDLSRVLRLPGTINHKGEPTAVSIVDFPGTRYNISALQRHVGAPEKTDARLASSANPDQYAQEVGPFELRLDAQPPFDKWEALRTADEQAEKAWRRARRDLDDQSPSGYDLSLATIANAAGWDDQEIVDLLVAARRHNGEDCKLGRHDYYARTLMRARESTLSSTSVIDDMEESVEELTASGDDEVEQGLAREDALEKISSALGVRITNVIRYEHETPTYRIITPTRSTKMKMNTLLNASQFRCKIAEATSVVINRFKPTQWDRIAQAILHAAECVDTGDEATEAGAAHQWVTDYLLDHPPATEIDEQVAQMRLPYVDGDERTVIFGPAFQRWLNVVRGERVSAQVMGEMLRSMGAETYREMVTVNGKRTSRSVWRMPPGM